MKDEASGWGRWVSLPASSRSPLRVKFSLNALLAIIVANFVLQPLTEPDFGWHLRAGLDFIQQGGRVPVLDPYSHTMPDWPWVEHAWLTDILIGLVYSTVGALAVILVFGTVTATAWFMAASSSGQTTAMRLSACVLSLWVALPFLGARTQMITWAGLAFLMWAVHRLQAGDNRILWSIPPLFLLWANLHGGFTAGLLYLALVILVSWAVRLSVPSAVRESVLSLSTLSQLALVTGIGAALTLVNPYGAALHREIFESLSDRLMIESLKEWHPVTLDTFAGKIFVLYLAGLGCTIIAWYRRVEPVRWGIWLVFLFFAWRHLRNIPLFLLVTVPLVAELLQAAFTRASGLPVVRNASSWQQLGGCVLALGLLLLYLGPEHVQRVWQFGVAPAAAFRQTSYPIEAVEWIKAHRDRLGTRLLHDYSYGGFLLWWLPGEKIFIDGRMPAWRIGDRWIFKDYVDVRESDPPRLEVLEKYGIDWSLLKRDSRLAQAFATLPAWRKEYEDRKVVIYATEPQRPPVYSRTAEGGTSGESRDGTSGSE